jgi:hypothetical protein
LGEVKILQLLKIALPYITAIFTGILIFVGGSVIVKFFVEPLREFSRVKSRITESLIFYANVYINPGWGTREKMDEAQEVLRQRASELKATTESILCYRLWESLKILPTKKADVETAVSSLIGLSNAIHNSRFEENNKKRVKEIEKLLSIKTGISL